MDLGTCVHTINYINSQLHHNLRNIFVRVLSLPLLKSFCFVYTFINIRAKIYKESVVPSPIFFQCLIPLLLHFRRCLRNQWGSVYLLVDDCIHHSSTFHALWKTPGCEGYTSVLDLDGDTSKQVWSPQPQQDENSCPDNAYPIPILTIKAFQSCISSSTENTQAGPRSLKFWL